jgi:hypothetical protein
MVGGGGRVLTGAKVALAAAGGWVATAVVGGAAIGAGVDASSLPQATPNSNTVSKVNKTVLIFIGLPNLLPLNV